jgi:Domain of unknown function (DUF4249)
MKYVNFLFGVILLFTACKREFIPDVTTDPNLIVVEGYIEASNRATPLYIIMTRAIPFYQETSGLGNNYVRGAKVKVSDGTDSVTLTEICWADLDTTTRKSAALLFGFRYDSIAPNFNFCVYIDLAQRMRGQNGKTYSLNIQVEGKNIQATTTIPRRVPLDSLSFIKPPGNNQNDTMAQARAIARDPIGPDFYRYFTSINGGAYVVGGSSVVDDQLFDGQTTKFNLFKSEPRNPSADNKTFGLFYRGDSVSIKFCTLDRAHFDFWQSFEANARSGGPFSSYTRVQYNVKADGAIGIWGGYSVDYYNTRVPKK